MDAYDSKTASGIVGISLRQIQYWDEQGFIRPSIKLAEGRGTKRLYSFDDLICLKVVKDLTQHGVSLQTVRRCVRPLRKYGVGSDSAPASLKYLTDGEKMFVITDDRKKILHAMEREFVLSLDIGSLVRELNGQIKRAGESVQVKRARTQRRPDEKRSRSA